MPNISRLTVTTKKDLEGINELLRQLLHDKSEFVPVSIETLKKIIDDEKTIVVAARDQERIVGVGLVCVIQKFRGRYGYVEDMVVDESLRGRGIGSAVMMELINCARADNISTLELSTRPERAAANHLYQKLGFIQKETNVYRLKL